MNSNADRPVRTLRLFLLGLVLPVLVFAQEQAAPARPRLGLVLSGGGARGLAHIGVLKVLEEERLNIEVVTGTSMGSIVGGLYAIGYSPAELEQIARETDWIRVLSDQVGRRRESIEQKMQEGRYVVTLPLDSGRIRLPESLVAGQLVSEMLTRLTAGYHQEMSFRDLPIPFACVAADIETGEPVMFDKGVLPEAIRASMSIPTMFKPVALNGRTWVDGGISRNLPAVDALELGATVLLAVDVSSQLKPAEELNNLVDVMEQTVYYSMATSSAVQKEYCELVVEPDMNAFHLNSYGDYDAIIRAGEQAARAMLPRIRRMADSLQLRLPEGTPYKRRNPDRQSYRLTGFDVRNLQTVSLATVRSDLNLMFPSDVTGAKIQEAVARVYGSGFFTYVRYRLVPESGGHRLVLDVVENRQSAMRAGFRFDSHNRASILMNVFRQNVITEGGLATLDMRIGDDLMLDGTLMLHTGFRPRFGMRLNVNAIRSQLDVYDEVPERIDNLQITASYADIMTGIMYRNWFVAGWGGRIEGYRYNSNQLPGGGTRYDQNLQWFLNWYGLLWMDRMDRSAFPRSGFSVQSRLSFSRELMGYGQNFTYHYADLRGALPLSPEASAFGRAYAGTGTDKAFPAHYHFYLGGANTPAVYGNRHVPFVGLPPVQRFSSNLRMWQAGLQYEFMRNRFVQVIYNEGAVFPDWRNPLGSNWIRGGGVVVGGLTPFGPVDITVGASSANTVRVELNFGFRF